MGKTPALPKVMTFKFDDLVKSRNSIEFVIPANPGSSPGQAPESRVPGENRDPVFEMVPDFRRDDVWTPVFTGVTTFYENIKDTFLYKNLYKI